jgi:hypothetical protein
MHQHGRMVAVSGLSLTHPDKRAEAWLAERDAVQSVIKTPKRNTAGVVKQPLPQNSPSKSSWK